MLKGIKISALIEEINLIIYNVGYRLIKSYLFYSVHDMPTYVIVIEKHRRNIIN